MFLGFVLEMYRGYEVPVIGCAPYIVLYMRVAEGCRCHGVVKLIAVPGDLAVYVGNQYLVLVLAQEKS